MSSFPDPGVESVVRPDGSPDEASSLSPPGPSSTPGTVTKPRVRFVPLSEFLARPSPATKWIVNGLLPAGGTSLLSSKPRVGKSTFVRSMMLSVARGEPFLGRETSPVRVAYLSLEDIDPMVKDDFLKMGARPDDPIYIHTGDLDPFTAADEVAEFIGDVKPGLVVVDTLGKFLPIIDFNDYGKVNILMARVTSILRQFPETHLMFIHHSKKTSEGEDDYLGSVAFHGNVDVFLRMGKSGENRVISARQQRYGIDLDSTVLTIDQTTGRVQSSTPGLSNVAKEAARADAILQAVKEGARTWRQVREVVEGRNKDLARLRDAMLMSGALRVDDNNFLSVGDPS